MRRGTLKHWGALIVAATVLGAGVVRAQQSIGDTPRRGSAAIEASLPASAELTRLREGAQLVNREGTFKVTGDRITFYPSDDQASAFQTLENLALERVWRLLAGARDRTWRVSGTVTEYRGANYLLLSRAVLKARVVGDPINP